MLKDFDLRQLITPLGEWFQKNARELPWREDPTPYQVWVSEIMLQQTRVEAVKPYYARFLKALPDVRALADCPEDRYLKLWEGLGYYSRVRNMHQAAVQVMEDYGGKVPDDYETLLKLKGIGSYTAGAIASIAYGKAVPAVDGNVLRILTRVSADDSDIAKPAFKKEAEALLKDLMQKVCPKQIAPGTLNQALMELGAIVCVPNGEPYCELCPWKDLCRARAEGKIDKIPYKTKAKARRIEEKTVLLIRDGDKVAIRKRPAKGLLAGLYEYPNHEGHFSENEALQYVRDMGYAPLRIKRLPDSVHIFSHVEWHMIAYHLLVEEEAFATKEQTETRRKERLIFVDRDEQKEHYAVPSAFHAYKYD
ncbi:MAG: A/G-specific adenine glycosylase [Lachnospiraceae bacterium]|nr:A/G-specific adenine glycosylase [Lachnospiraceae bacterium]